MLSSGHPRQLRCNVGHHRAGQPGNGGRRPDAQQRRWWGRLGGPCIPTGGHQRRQPCADWPECEASERCSTPHPTQSPGSPTSTLAFWLHSRSGTGLVLPLRPLARKPNLPSSIMILGACC